MPGKKLVVLRLMRYEYDTPERMVEDMQNWTTQYAGRDMRMVSVNLHPSFMEDLNARSEALRNSAQHLPPEGRAYNPAEG